MIIHDHPHISGYRQVFSEDGNLLGTLERMDQRSHAFRPAQGVIYLTYQQLQTLAAMLKGIDTGDK